MEQQQEIISAVKMDSSHPISPVHGGGDADPKVDVVFGEESDFAFGDPASGDDTEFAFVPRDPDSGNEITADEIFSNGRIRASFPLFGRDLSLSGPAAADPMPMIPIEKLAIEDRDSFAVSTSSSECGDEQESLPDGTYCVWSPDRRRRSASANEARRRLVPDLGEGRSRSDGNEKFKFLARPPPPPPEKKSRGNSSLAAPNPKGRLNEKKGKGSKVTEMDMVTAFKLHYSKKGGEAVKSGKRSFLPYRPEVFGFFGNAASRGQKPF